MEIKLIPIRFLKHQKGLLITADTILDLKLQSKLLEDSGKDECYCLGFKDVVDFLEKMYRKD